MKLYLQHRHHQPSATFSSLIASELESLQAALQIDEARVLIERRPEASPAVRVAAHLVTPGPDIQVEGVDHTLRAALQKLVAGLSDHIERRHPKRARRFRSNLQQPAIRRGAALRHA